MPVAVVVMVIMPFLVPVATASGVLVVIQHVKVPARAYARDLRTVRRYKDAVLLRDECVLGLMRAARGAASSSKDHP